MKQFLFTLILGGIFVSMVVWSGCSKESFITDGAAKLSFSTDTLRFDTAFTTVGTATYSFRIYNTHSQPINISRVYLPGNNGKKSFFSLNVDGFAGNDLKNIEIPANDSIYVFARVTIDPNLPLSESPYVIQENLIFETNGNQQNVVLEAWGQDANYIPSNSANGQIARLSANFQTIVWNDPKPYVIYGILLLDSVTLEIAAGTKIHVHGGLAKNDALGGRYNDGIIYLYPSASIRILGNKDKPVVIQGDRLEDDYKDESGQWAGIIIGAGSRNNVMEYATIKNSIVGVRVDSSAQLTLKNTRIYNTAGSGLQAIHADVNADNCLFYNNNSDAVTIAYGGNYNFNYCTVVSYGADAIALSLSNTLCYDVFCNKFDTYPMVARFTNCIFFGSRRDEISLFNAARQTKSSELDYRFENCVFRVEELLGLDNYPEFKSYATNCVYGKPLDRLFIDVDKDDYHLDSLSVASDKAKFLMDIPIDIDGKVRNTQKPDVGSFEREN